MLMFVEPEEILIYVSCSYCLTSADLKRLEFIKVGESLKDLVHHHLARVCPMHTVVPSKTPTESHKHFPQTWNVLQEAKYKL